MEYLLDSDWIIHMLGGRYQAVTLLDQLTPQRVAITSVTLGELYDGAFGYVNSQAHIEHI